MDYLATSHLSVSGGEPVESDNVAMPGPSHHVDTDTADLMQSTATEVDVDSTKSSSSSAGPRILHSDFDIPNESSFTQSGENSNDDADLDKRKVLVEGKSPQEQVKYIEFEEATLDVFGHCSRCGAKCILAVESQIGSLCSIKISCTAQIEHSFQGTTGPSLFKMPAFHLLLVSGILATGMEPQKLFDCSMR